MRGSCVGAHRVSFRGTTSAMFTEPPSPPRRVENPAHGSKGVQLRAVAHTGEGWLRDTLRLGLRSGALLWWWALLCSWRSVVWRSPWCLPPQRLRVTRRPVGSYTRKRG